VGRGGILKEGGELLVRRGSELLLGPEIGGKVGVGLDESVVGGEDEVAQSLGVTTRLSVAIVDTSVLQDLLGGLGSDKVSTTRSGDEADADGTTLAGDLARDGVGGTELLDSPIATTNRDDGELSIDESTTDGAGDFLSALGAEADVTVTVTADDPSFELGTLTGSSLLLDGGDLHDLILQDVLREEVINDLELLDGESVEVDVLEILDLASLDETTELGDGDPALLLTISALATTSTTTSTSATTTSTALLAVFVATSTTTTTTATTTTERTFFT